MAQIVTFGTMAARGVIRDVGRVLDMPYSYVDTIAKSIPMEKDITIAKAIANIPDLRQLYETDEQTKYLARTWPRSWRGFRGIPRSMRQVL